MTDKRESDMPPRTPHHRIIIALSNIVMLHDDDNGRIARDQVMAEVQHIRSDADQLARDLDAMAEQRDKSRFVSEKMTMAAETYRAQLEATIEQRDGVRAEVLILTDVLNLARQALLVSIKGTPDDLGSALGKLNLACKAHWDWQTARDAAATAFKIERDALLIDRDLASRSASGEPAAWIQCSDHARLPATDVQVLGWFPGMKQPTIVSGSALKHWALDDDAIDGAVWQPLPEPPK